MASPDLCATVRAGLESLGWTVGALTSKGRVFEAQQDSRRLTVVICRHPELNAIAAAYQRLLSLDLHDDEHRGVVVVDREGAKALEAAAISPEDRLKINVLVVYDDGFMTEIPAETIATPQLPRGPAGWRNWRAAELGMTARAREEYALHSDSSFVGEIAGLGPVDLINTVSRNGRAVAGDGEQALVLRVVWNIPAMALLTGPGEPKTQTEAYYEGWVGDEYAALVSLALDVRLMNGGQVRAWYTPDGLDGPGKPGTFFHHTPALSAPQYGQPRLPTVTRDRVALTDARPLLEAYGRLPAQRATAVVRAARQYQQALWIADEMPGLAWLQLVSALETAASLEAQEKPGMWVLDALKPAWAEVLRSATSPNTTQVVNEIAKVNLSAQKIRRLVGQHLPEQPAGRPDEPHAIDWDRLVELVVDIYSMRGSSVHEGLPLPAPLLGPPSPATHPFPERPGGTIGSQDSIWTTEDMPMYMHTFAFVVGSVLRSWWASLDVPTPTSTLRADAH